MRVNFAENQPEYRPLPAFVTPEGKVISQWLPDANERAMINAGTPITLMVLHGEFTEANRLRPVLLAVGGVDAR